MFWMYDFQLNCRLRQAAGENVEKSSCLLPENLHIQSSPLTTPHLGLAKDTAMLLYLDPWEFKGTPANATSPPKN